MNRAKIILAIVLLVAGLGVLLAFGVRPIAPVSNPATAPAPQPSAGGSYGPAAQNAFLNTPGMSGASLAGNGEEQQTPTFNDLAQAVTRAMASATIPAAGPQAGLLSFPDVPDSEIAIDASGASSIKEFLNYFNVNYSKISFDTAKFNDVLKDPNKVPLFTQSLIDKAIADKNFSEIKDSLLVQKDFAAAVTAYIKTIKVTGSSTIALDKKAIGAEGLLIQLIDKALAVGNGTMTQKDFVTYYGRFSLTMSQARQALIAQTGALSMAPEDNWTSWFLKGFNPVANAQIGLTPFGGRVVFILPCTCSFGVLVTIGSPTPAVLFVPYSFLGSPLFYSYKNLDLLIWWLGLKTPVVVPCLQIAIPVCVPTGFGNVIYDTGTSAIP